MFHPKRQKEDKSWYFSPHYHVLGYGWVQNVHDNFMHTRYVVKNIGIRKTVGGTIWYQLSHAGVGPKRHVVSWFGVCAYNKLKVFDLPTESNTCPICGSKLKKLLWIGSGVCPLGDVDGLKMYGDTDGWIVKPNDWELSREND